MLDGGCGHAAGIPHALLQVTMLPPPAAIVRESRGGSAHFAAEAGAVRRAGQDGRSLALIVFATPLTLWRGVPSLADISTRRSAGNTPKGIRRAAPDPSGGDDRGTMDPLPNRAGSARSPQLEGRRGRDMDRLSTAFESRFEGLDARRPKPGRLLPPTAGPGTTSPSPSIPTTASTATTATTATNS